MYSTQPHVVVKVKERSAREFRLLVRLATKESSVVPYSYISFCPTFFFPFLLPSFSLSLPSHPPANMMMDLANLIYNFDRQQKNVGEEKKIKEEIMSYIVKDSMAPLYISLSEKYEWELDSAIVATMKTENEKELELIKTKSDDAVANAGDMEVLDCMFDKARYYSKIGNWKEAYDAYDLILAKEKTSTGKKIDANMEIAKIALFCVDIPKLKAILSEAKRLNELGGDWDRRNRLKVYEALYLLLTRDMKEASKLLMDCVATFTCTELCTYKQFMFYALLCSVITLNRNDLRKKVINDPHVITIIRELSNVQSLINGIYNCDYKSFFQAILTVHPEIMENRFLGPLSVYLVRELRVLAYAQFLEAYKSVLFSSMATSFGITPTLLDSELSRFIAAGRYVLCIQCI